jgi:hypothetical protein
MQIRGGRVESSLYPKRTACTQLLDEFLFDQHLLTAALDDLESFRNGGHGFSWIGDRLSEKGISGDGRFFMGT